MADYDFSWFPSVINDDRADTATQTEKAEGIMRRKDAKTDTTEEKDPMGFASDAIRKIANAFSGGPEEARRVLSASTKYDSTSSREKAALSFEEALAKRPGLRYLFNDTEEFTRPPTVDTTSLGPDMGTLAEQDAQEQSAIRSVSGVTESLRPAPEGLMRPPVRDTVPEVDTDTAEPVADTEETTTTAPTRDELIDSVFDAEGGYSTDVNDTGNYYRGQFVGTNHGISAPVLAEHLGRTPTVEDMRGLSQDTAREIAATQYYDAYNISDLPEDTQEIVFHAVYMGGSRGVRAVQNLTGATPDGVMGPNTRTAMQESTFTPQEFRDEYLRELEFGTTGYSSPANTWDNHGRGWTNRYNTLAGE